MRGLVVGGLLFLFCFSAVAQDCDAPKVSGLVICPGDSATLIATAPGGTYEWFDAISGGTLIATGDTLHTPSLTQNTTYFVQTTTGSCVTARTAVTVSMRPNPTASGATICSGNSVTLTAVAPGGDYEWFDSAVGGASLQTGSKYDTPVLTETTTYYVQTTVNGCTSGRTPVTVTVNTNPVAPQASDAAICFGSAVTLTASGSSGLYQWFSSETGGVPLITSPDYTTPGLTATTTYYVQAISNGCTSNRTPVKVTVYPIPAGPVIAGTTICSGTSATLVAADSQGTYQWFAVPSRGSVLAEGGSYTTAVLTRTTTFYVQMIVNGCVSARMPVTVTVNKAPAAPLAAGKTICTGNTATLTATAPIGTLTWYDAAVGGNALETGATFSTPVLTGSETFYIQTVVDGCASTRTAVKVTVVPPPSTPLVSDVSICAGSSATLTVTGSGSGVYEWFDAVNGGKPISTGPQLTTPALAATTIFYVQLTANGCTSPRSAVTVTVNSAVLPIASGTTICSESSATLTATAPQGTLEWYSSALGGTLLGSGSTFITPALNSATTYYVQNTVNGCVSPRTPVIVKITDFVSLGFKYEAFTFCITGTDAIPKIFDPAGGTFTASPAGLVFADNTTGQIDVKASKMGHYTIVFTSKGACPHITRAGFTITNLLNTAFKYKGPYCQADSIVEPEFDTGASGGIFSATPEGLVLTGRGGIDLSQSRPGIYTVRNFIPASGDCISSESTTQVIIYPSVKVDAGADQSIPPGGAAILKGTVSDAKSYLWSGGTGSFSDPTSLTARYTPGPNETTATLYLNATPTGLCNPKTDAVVISMNLFAPKASPATVCTGSPATLTASGSGGTYMWYDAPVGGKLLIANAVFVTPPILKATTYYVEAASEGNFSQRTAVTVTPSSPQVPVISGVTICMGSTATLTPIGGGLFNWYNAETGGDLLASSSSFTTPALTSTTTYYVEALANGCVSARKAVEVVVNPIPEVTSAAMEVICNSVGLNYKITASVPGTTFLWSRKALPAVVNPAVANQTSSTINEVITTTATTPVDVTYEITPIFHGCAGPVFNYVVTVDPSPVVTSPAKGAICNNTASNYTIEFNLPGTGFSWSRAAVPGISNPAVSGQASPTIKEVLSNITNAPVDVTYAFNHSYNGCAGPTFNYVVTVNPVPYITSRGGDYLCTGNILSYNITSNVAGATFTWSRAENQYIKNTAIVNQETSIINETLTNTGTAPVEVIYTIVPSANGCTGPAFNYRVTVLPTPVVPVMNGSSAVCIDKPIALSTTQIAGATYLWTGPNGFRSTQLNPVIPRAALANSGDYQLIVTINGCVGLPGTKAIKVNALPVANAGSDQTACGNTIIQLAGTIGGGATTGIWTSNGSGSFSPSNTALNASYTPSDADRNTGAVKLTLTSTSADNCSPATSSVNITLVRPPVVEAGPDQNVCTQDGQVFLFGKTELATSASWKTSGTGTFNPSNAALDAVYIPSSSDLSKGNVTLALTASGSNVCVPVMDAVNIKFTPPPMVEIGQDVLVPFGRTITLNPSVSESNVKYLWTPNINMNDNTLKNPTITGAKDQVYTLTVTDSRGCVTEDKIYVDILNPIIVPNTFTPNGDGVNDVWNIPELTTYPGNTVNIFNRYGAKVFTSVGYGTVWDGNCNGVPAPVGTYYYIIDTQFKDLLYSGSITILR